MISIGNITFSIQAVMKMDFRFTPGAGSLRLCALALAAFTSVSVFSQETDRQYLSGLDKDRTVDWRFQCTAGWQSGYWTNIPVPSQWELRGFGTLNYFNDKTNAPLEQGLYQHTFKVPPAWADRRVFLVFDGVMTDTRATINGQSVGPLHQGGFYRFKYEVTKLLQFGGDNQLEVTVDKHSANPSVNRAERQGDYWLFGGIYRPVFLEATPAQFIERLAVDARADGSFALEVTVNGLEGAAEVTAQITTLDGQPAAEAFGQTVKDGKALLKTQVIRPRLWTAETPNLYRVEARLQQGPRTWHRVRQTFGFRTMEVRAGDGLYLNGRRIVLQGCDRHSAWPESGRCLSESIHRLDIQLMKEMNMNAVRMSHYPPDERFLELCDELGLYVLDELGGWQKSYDTTVGRRLVEEMVLRDVNHPSILFWDNGNEGGWNRALDGEFARWDPQHRTVLHPWENFNGVNTAHYRTYSAVQAICAGTNLYMPTEFMHGLYDGGAGAGLEDHWGLMRQSKILGGGFIWALLDEGIQRPDNGRIDVSGNQAPDGILGPYRQKEGSFYAVKELWSPLVVLERELPENFSGALTIENRYSFTDANQCTFTWQLRRLHGPAEPTAGFDLVASGQAPAPSIPPGGKGTLRLELPANWKSAGALALRAADPTGRELWEWVWPLPELGRFRAAIAAPAPLPVSTRATPEHLRVTAGDFTAQFSKTNGFLTGVQRGKQAFSFANGPRPAAGSARLTSLEKTQDGADAVITAHYEGDLRSVTWRMRGNGWLECRYVYAAEGNQEFIGVAFDYPESLVLRKKWLGEGPYRVWKNRRRGVTLNVWQNDYNHTITGWSDWNYPEFKGCFAHVRWLQLETREGLITVVNRRDDTDVQVLIPDFPPTNLQAKTAVSLPQAGLAFLQAIPPIGNKFHAARDTGPQGQLNPAHGEYSGIVDFYFGEIRALP
jgi:hypothetical protein